MTAVVVPPVRAVILFHGMDLQHVERFEAHLAPAVRVGRLHLWHHAKLIPGDDERRRIGEEIARAHLILLFVSAEFNAHYHDQIEKVLEETPTVRLIPLSVRPCIWSDTRFFGLRPIPPDGTPIVAVPDDERRFQDAAREFLRAVNVVREQDQGLMATVQSPWAVNALAAVEAELYTITHELNALREARTGTILASIDTNTLSNHETEALAVARDLVQDLRVLLDMNPTGAPFTLETLVVTLQEAHRRLSNNGSKRPVGPSVKTVALAITAMLLGMLTVLIVTILLSKTAW